MNNSNLAVRDICPTEYPIRDISIWSTYSISHIQFTGIPNFVYKHDVNLPPGKTITDSLGRTRTYSKGHLNGACMELSRVFAYQCLKQMEELRQTDPERYERHIRTGIFALTTNRVYIQKKLPIKRSLSSISNDIIKLQEANIITDKRNTSRKRRIEIEEDGHKTIILEMMPNGRGDFIIYLNPQLFSDAFRHPEKFPTSLGNVHNHHGAVGNDVENTGPENFEKTKDCDLEADQIQNLEQCIGYSKDTTQLINNNCGNPSNSEGVPAAQQNSNPKIVDRNTGNINQLPLPDPGNAQKMIRLVGKDAEKSTRERVYRQKLRKDNKAKSLLPEKDKEFYAQILFYQLINMLYPDISRDYLNSIQEDIKRLLFLQLNRIDLPVDQAFEKVSRAIFLAKRWLIQDPDRYVYDILTYLRIDEEFNKGTLKHVVDVWVKNEEKRLKMRAEKKSNFIKWQAAENYAQKLFRSVVHTLKENAFSNAKVIFKEGIWKIDWYCSKIKISKDSKTRKKVKDTYIGKCVSILSELNAAVEEEYDAKLDPTMLAIEQWRKMASGMG